MDRPYFCAYHSYLEALEPLNDAEKGRLFVACLTYSMTGEVPQLSGNERFVFPSLRGQIDRDKARFAELDRKQAENGRKGGRPRKKPKEPENEEESSSKQKPPDGGLLLPLSQEEAPHPSPEATWIELGLGKRISPVLNEMLTQYRQAGITDAVIAAAMKEAAEFEAKAPVAYIRGILDRCQAQSIYTLDAWQACHHGGGGKRVDRATPSGNDFLADALSRPRRHKRTG